MIIYIVFLNPLVGLLINLSYLYNELIFVTILISIIVINVKSLDVSDMETYELSIIGLILSSLAITWIQMLASIIKDIYDKIIEVRKKNQANKNKTKKDQEKKSKKKQTIKEDLKKMKEIA